MRTIAPPAKTPIWRHVVSLVLLGAVVFGIGQCVIQVTDRPEFLSLKYETVGPSPEEARAVVYLLHGYGAPGDDLVSLAKEIAAVGNPDVSFIVVQAPYSHAGGWTWGDSAAEESKAIDRLRKLIGETVGDKPPAAVAVGGFSQGANVSRLVTLADEHIGTALLLSGCRYGPVTPDEPGDVVYFISHGQLDGVCNPSASTILSDELKKRGNPTHFLSFKGGHEIPPEVATAAGEELQKLRAAPSP